MYPPSTALMPLLRKSLPFSRSAGLVPVTLMVLWAAALVTHWRFAESLYSYGPGSAMSGLP